MYVCIIHTQKEFPSIIHHPLGFYLQHVSNKRTLESVLSFLVTSKTLKRF